MNETCDQCELVAHCLAQGKLRDKIVHGRLERYTCHSCKKYVLVFSPYVGRYQDKHFSVRVYVVPGCLYNVQLSIDNATYFICNPCAENGCTPEPATAGYAEFQITYEERKPQVLINETCVKVLHGIVNKIEEGDK
jgi:hypothetical protein